MPISFTQSVIKMPGQSVGGWRWGVVLGRLCRGLNAGCRKEAVKNGKRFYLI